jgi:2-hydroxychromene-2-carboxylate isomerase
MVTTWTQILALGKRHDRDVQPVPVLFAGLLGAHGHKGPAEIPAKRLYVVRDTLRIARKLGVPLSPPPTHPFNSLLALRVASIPTDMVTAQKLVDVLFRATWAGGGGVEDANAVKRVVTSVGLDAEALVAQAALPETKTALRDQTDVAVREGVFVVPSMFADDELFWGVDSLEYLQRHLAGEGALDAAAVARGESVAPSARRRI